MDSHKLQQHVAQQWRDDILPALLDYMAIPCESPAFDPDWASHGHLHRAAGLLAQWVRLQLRDVAGAKVDVVALPRCTPLLLVEVPGEGDGTVLVYGHYDKQPAMGGWTQGRSAWCPAVEGDRLYGRGGADDGYAVFSAVAAVRALRGQGLRHPRCVFLIEGCEESGSGDLPAYMDHLAPRIGRPELVIALDANCGNYDQLWLTTSLRGQVAGTLQVRVLEQGVHSGEASGVVPSSFRIACQLLSRIEDPATGAIAAPFHAAIPGARRRQAATAAATLGAAVVESLPLAGATRALDDDVAELLLNRSWRPQLTVTGIDGLPGVAAAAAVMQPSTALKLSLRLPPTLEPHAAAERLKELLEAQPPYASEVEFAIDMVSPGWHAPETAPWLAAALDAASRAAFGRPGAWFGGGGGIPFLALLGERFPQAQFVVTGVLGPHSNAHGPDEFLHLPMAERVTVAVAQILHAAASRSMPSRDALLLSDDAGDMK